MKKINKFFVGVLILSTLFVSGSSYVYAKSINNKSYLEKEFGKNNGDIVIKSSFKKKYKAGDKINVKWTDKTNSNVAVALLTTDESKNLPTYDSIKLLDAGVSEYEFTIDKDMPSGDYFILVYAERGYEQWHYSFSKAFSIKTSKSAVKAEDAQKFYDNKSLDTTIITYFANMRSKAELYYDENNYSYKNLCNSKTSQINADLKMFKDGYKVKVDCDASATEYAIEAKLKSEDGYYCVDSTGKASVQPKSKGSKATLCKK